MAASICGETNTFQRFTDIFGAARLSALHCYTDLRILLYIAPDNYIYRFAMHASIRSLSLSLSAAWPYQPNAPTYNSPQCVLFSVHIVCTHEICLAHTLSSSKTRHTRQPLSHSGRIRGCCRSCCVVALISFTWELCLSIETR